MMNKIKKALKNNKGFTLIELIIVIAVVVLLASITIPSYLNVIESAKEAEYTSAARNGYLALMVEYTEHQVALANGSATAAFSTVDPDVIEAVADATGLESSTTAGFTLNDNTSSTGGYSVTINMDTYSITCDASGIADSSAS